jgi:glycosidase
MGRSLALLLLPLALASCGGAAEPSSSEDGAFVDAAKEENRIGDNYRNYYEIFVSSFADSDGDGTGDLSGIDQKLDYLSSVGYTGLWLSPIFESGTYHKYDAKDYFAIDSSFGTMDDLRTLVADAHEKGMKVILDGVFNHSGLYCAWFQKSMSCHSKKLSGETLSEEEADYADLYSFADSEEEKEGGHTWYQAGGYDFYYEANFSSSMPELNFDSEFAFTQIESVIDYYMGDEQGIGVDGFRLDAVKYYDLGATAHNVEILNRIEKMIKDNDPEGYAVGECWDASGVIGSYYESDLDSYFWFPGAGGNGSINLSVTYDGSGKNRYYSFLGNMASAAGSHIPAPFIDNHDMPRMSKSKDGSTTKFQLGLRDMAGGAVFNYYGDEIGMTSYDPGGDYADSNYRTHYYWDDETHAMECSDPPYAQDQTEHYPAAATQEKDEGSVLSYEKKALRLRNSYPSIARGALSVDPSDSSLNEDGDSPLLAFLKTYGDEEIKIVINFSFYDSAVYDAGDYVPQQILLVNLDKKAYYRDTELELPPHAIALLQRG